MIWNEENRNLSNIPLAGVVLGSGIDSDERFVEKCLLRDEEYYDGQVNRIKRTAKKHGYDWRTSSLVTRVLTSKDLAKLYTGREVQLGEGVVSGVEGNPKGRNKNEKSASVVSPRQSRSSRRRWTARRTLHRI